MANNILRFTGAGAAAGNYGVAYTAAIEIPTVPATGPAYSATGGSQVVSIDATTPTAAGTAVGYVVWYDAVNGVARHIEEFAVTATAYRTGSGGASGDYICTVAFTTTGNNKIDLLGIGPIADLRTSPLPPSNIKVYVGIYSITTSTIIDIVTNVTGTI